MEKRFELVLPSDVVFGQRAVPAFEITEAQARIIRDQCDKIIADAVRRRVRKAPYCEMGR